jgi:APA family basic amino acid/polyamine antiporter
MSTQSEPVQTLPRQLGAFDAMMVIVGSIIGSGIFLKPGVAAAELPSVGLIFLVWIAVGIVSLCGCLALAELAAMLPHAGGPYVYLREAYGRMPAFLWGWTEFWIVRTGSIGALAVATAVYLNQIVVQRSAGTDAISLANQERICIAIVIFLTALNYVSTRWTAHLQNATSIIKIAFLGLIIVLPFVLGKVNPSNLQPLFPAEMTGSLWRGVALAMIAVMWPYDGWINIGPVAEEIRDPQRNVPRALVGGIGLIIAVYLSANLAYHLVLPLEQVATSKAVATDLMRAVLGPGAAVWVSLGVACSTFGAANSNMLCGPRIYFAMARDGLLPRHIDRVHERFQTPYNAVLIQGVWTVLLIIAAFHYDVLFKVEKKLEAGDAFDNLTNYVIFGGYIFYNMAVAAVFVLRWKMPDAPRPYRTWGYPVTPILYLGAFTAVLLRMVVEEKTRGTSLAGLGLIAAGVPFFLYMNLRRKRLGAGRDSL